jgi:hypothetical protein
MVIIETSVFTKQVTRLLDDEEYCLLQAVLVNRPDAGDIISGSGGLRKIRWGLGEHGKRGGVRVIYYWAVRQEKLVMLLLYPKNERDDLTKDQLKTLRRMIEEEYP